MGHLPYQLVQDFSHQQYEGLLSGFPMTGVRWGRGTWLRRKAPRHMAPTKTLIPPIVIVLRTATRGALMIAGSWGGSNLRFMLRIYIIHLYVYTYYV